MKVFKDEWEMLFASKKNGWGWYFWELKVMECKISGVLKWKAPPKKLWYCWFYWIKLKKIYANDR